ncbi:MAG: T9SS type A sorting domain-containing protein, partial [Flavobacteriales bacterium]|nr:T9SS type A sorting domain-containing protein [Flavobacteriales bacterium]
IIATDDDGCLVYGTSFTNDSVLERDVHIWKVLRDEINIITNVSETDEPTENITVFPNPATDQIFIQLGKGQNWDQSTVSVFTISGKKVFQQKICQQGNLLQMDIRNLEKGTYLLQVTGMNGKVLESVKVVKK